MKPRGHYLRYPIGETGWALMKILLNIAGWFLYFAQWQKSRYPCQFTLNSASCQGSLYQGASNAHPLLNDSKATSPDRGLTTPVMHTQDTLPCAGNPHHPSTSLRSQEKCSGLLVQKLSAGVSENFQTHYGWKRWPQLIADLNFFLSAADLFVSATSCHSWRSVYFHLHPLYSNDTEAVMSVDAHHLMFMPCGGGPTRRENNES